MLTSYNFCKFLLEAKELQAAGEKDRKICEKLCHKYDTSANNLRQRWKLHEQKKKEGQVKVKPGYNILDSESEASIISVLKSASECNKPMQRREIIEYVRKTYKNNDPDWRGDKWFTKFMKRNENEIRVNNLKVCTPQRVATSTEVSCEEFISVMKRLQDDLSAENIINVDESQLKVTGWGIGRKRIEAVKSSEMPRKVATGKRGSCCGSMIAFVRADGTLMFTCLCLKPDLLSKNGETGFIDVDLSEINPHDLRTRPVPQMKIFSESGMINNEIWSIIWEKFITHLKMICPGKKHYVFLDNLSQHAQISCVKLGLENDVEIIFLPKNTTHFLQPLDQFAFGTMKKEMNKLTFAKVVWSDISFINQILRDNVPQSMAKSFTPNIIKSSFEVCGIYPFNEDKIRSRYRENIGKSDEDEKLNDPMINIQKKCKHVVKNTFQKDPIKESSGGKRPRATVNLSQPYTSGDILQMAKMQAELKEQEARAKKQKIDEKKKLKEEKEIEAKIKKEAATKKKRRKGIDKEIQHV